MRKQSILDVLTAIKDVASLRFKVEWFPEHPKHERFPKPRPFKDVRNFQFLSTLKDFHP